MTKTTIFISRKLQNNSPFRQVLEGSAVSIIDQSLIEFQAIPFQEVPSTDWIFFYSKNGVKYFFEQLNQFRQIPTERPKLGTIGKATADFMEKKYGLLADFVGCGNPHQTATNFHVISTHQSILFVQARQSKQSIQKLLHSSQITIPFIVYDNIPKVDFKLPFSDILVFTSPLNAQTYFQQYPYQIEQKIIAIGSSTAKALNELGLVNCTIATTPHEQSLGQACLKIINSST
jgi:uroporphyrinogen-III synthase